MVGTRNSSRQTHLPNPNLESPIHALDPISLILSLNSSPTNPIPLKLTTDSYIMERGPRYRAYAELRETRLRMKCGKQQETEEIEFKETQKKKLVKSSSSLGISRKGCSVLAPSVPDFSETLRKENRKPPVTGAVELTFPGKNWSRGNDVPLSNSRGTKSANAGEKKGRLMITRNSFSAANGENRRRKISGNNKPVY